MQTNFKNLIELNDFFKEEKTCYEFLASQIGMKESQYAHIAAAHTFTPRKAEAPALRKTASLSTVAPIKNVLRSSQLQ